MKVIIDVNDDLDAQQQDELRNALRGMMLYYVDDPYTTVEFRE